jgi:hypothetical protein
MWSDDDGPFEGRCYQLEETICSPRPIQRPGPRILIGGGGEQKTLRLVARYADACNLFDLGPEMVAHKLEVLADHCEAEGRDPPTIEKTVISGSDPVGNPDGFLAGVEEYARLGMELVVVSPVGPDPAAWVSQLSERVVPRVATL